ncbi:MAG: hypothetical protein PUF95_03930 [Selenomonadaceae bacterium]|nr:hypothetical protein [Selenomonadaceae bacterium]
MVSCTSERLKQIMQERGLRQVDVLNACKPICEKLDGKIGKSDFSQYVSGKIKPKSDKVKIISLALNVSEAWLMGYDVPRERVISESNGEPIIASTTNNKVDELVPLLRKLDTEDLAEIRGEVKGMLKSDKYTTEKELFG